MAYGFTDPEGTNLNNPQDKEGNPNVRYWCAWLEQSKRASKLWMDAAKRAEAEYVNSGRGTDLSVKDVKQVEIEPRYPLFWSTIRTVQPTLYSRTPVVVANKQHDHLDDNIARLASTAYEDLAKYLIRACPFDRTMYAVRDDFLLAGKATPRIYFELRTTPQPKRTYYQPTVGQDGQTSYTDEQGNPFTEGELSQEGDKYYSETIEDQFDSIECCPIPAYYYDIRHTPNARNWDEIEVMAFRGSYSKEDIANRFDTDKVKYSELIPFGSIDRQKSDERYNPESEKSTLDQYVDIWEIWDKRNKKAIWICDAYYESALDVKDDPYGLDNFFPCPPFILGTCGTQHMYPTPDYTQLEALLLQVHGLAKRLQRVIKATQRKGVADGSVPELSDLAEAASETEFILIKNFRELLKDGDLDRVIKFFPTAEFAQAATELANALQLFEQKVEELYGIPDILKGTSDPRETAAAQQLKGKYLAVRHSALQREFQRLVRDTIELMCDVALGKFPEQKLIEIMGVQFWKPEDQQLWPQVMYLLRDDDERKIRLEIETDSTITINQDAETEQRNYLAQTMFQGFSAVQQAVQANPLFGSAAMELLIFVVQGIRAGKEVEQSLRKIQQQMLQVAAQPPTPPQPDPVDMGKLQIEQQRLQLDAQKAQGDQQIEQQKVALSQAEIQIKAKQLDIQYEELIAQSQNEQVKRALEMQQASFDQRMGELDAQLQQYKVVLDEREKLLEERRLRLEDQMALRDRITKIEGSSKIHKSAVISNDPITGQRRIDMIEQPLTE